MDNKAITTAIINVTIGGVEVFKMDVDISRALEGLAAMFQGRATDTATPVKENPELASCSALVSAGYRKLGGVKGATMWVRPEGPAFYTSSDGVWLTGERPTPHPITAAWIRSITQ
jgi:hypothetical protein